MCCHITCAISAIFIIGMIYFYSATHSNPIVKEYTQQLLSDRNNLHLPTFDGIEDNMELKMINSLKEIVEQRKLEGN